MASQLTPLQFALLSLIDGKTPGRLVRDGLAAKYGMTHSLPSFYQAMARLEDDGMVRGFYEQKVVDGQPIKERFYQRTAKGNRAVEETREFYGK